LPDAYPRPTGRTAAALAILCALATVVCLGAAAIRSEQLAKLGALIRRADDVTEERVFRLRVVGVGLGAAFGILAVYAWRRRVTFTQSLVQARHELRDFPGEAARWWDSLSISNRISYLLVVATGAALRLKYLNTPMAYDEAYSFTNFARRSLLEALSDYNNTNNHLLNTFFMHVMYRLFGQQEWALRLPVLIAGVVLVIVSFPWARARIGAAPALVATALLAGSPMMIDYSVNARGYTFLALFAILLDACFLRIALANSGSPRAATWIAAGLCIWLGFFAMPTFFHPLAGLVVWFALNGKRTRSPRLLPLIVCLAASGLAVACTYAPAFVFRGTLAWQNDFVQPLPLAKWAAEFPTAVWGGIARWIAGGVPGAILIVLAWGGVVAWIRRSVEDRASLTWGGLAITSMLLVSLALMGLQRVAPPPRLFFFQAPWFYLLAATGFGYAVGLLQRLKAPIPGDGAMRFAAYAALAAGVWFSFENPILREPHQREFGVGSVPAALQRAADLARDDRGPIRLYAPLPCDHPAIFYASKFQAPVAINGAPRSGERLLLLTRPGDKPATTLRDVVVRQEDLITAIPEWRIGAEFPELTLWEASQRFRDDDTMRRTRPQLEKTP